MKMTKKDKERLASGEYWKCSGCKKIHKFYLIRYPNKLNEQLYCRKCGAITIRPIILERFGFVLEHGLNQVRQKIIYKSEFGDKWPFDVDSGWLKCYGHDREITFIVEENGSKIEYALNGIANNNPEFKKIKFIHSKDETAYHPDTRKDLFSVLEYAIYDLYEIDKVEYFDLFTRVV